MGNQNVYDTLAERGFIQQVTYPEELKSRLEKEQMTFYVGFDPTADSLHAGHLMAIMGMVHLQRAGHRPIAVVGGGTAMVGDPSGKSKMRKMLTREQIVENSQHIKKQLSRFLDFSEGKAILVDNYDWLGNLKYIEFLRDIGRHFSVNRMLTYETYKMRLEKGLSFLEFNYQLLQSYDFLVLSRDYNCRLQMGGDDQWANIIAGADLIRRVDRTDVFGLTFPLLVTASGTKMGKTESGALWLDPDKTSPYEYFQYWVNVDDRDVVKLLSFFTLLPIGEIDKVKNLGGSDLNTLKTILAYEATKIAHSEDEAEKSLASALAAFGSREIPSDILCSSLIKRGKLNMAGDSIPSSTISSVELEKNPYLIDILLNTRMVQSKSQARRLVQQGGVYVNELRVENIEQTLGFNEVIEKTIDIRLGKKKFFKLLVE
jgi:tyrosyl-tRNA synthetase